MSKVKIKVLSRLDVSNADFDVKQVSHLGNDIYLVSGVGGDSPVPSDPDDSSDSSSSEEPDPGPIPPENRNTVFHFADSPDEEYLIEGELGSKNLIELGFKINGSTWISGRMPTSVEIGTAVTNIGDNTFIDCLSLTSVIIPDTVISIGEYAFSGCYNLSSLVISNSLESIGNNAFMDTQSLKTFIVPSSVDSIGRSAFFNESGILTDIFMEGKTMYQVQSMENYSWSIKEGVVIHCSDGDFIAPAGEGS